MGAVAGLPQETSPPPVNDHPGVTIQPVPQFSRLFDVNNICGVGVVIVNV